MNEDKAEKVVTRRGIFLGMLVGVPAAALVALFTAKQSEAGGDGGGDRRNNDDDDDN